MRNRSVPANVSDMDLGGQKFLQYNVPSPGPTFGLKRNADCMASNQTKERIAILGGGIGALTTAYELTSVPNWQERYEITVYQQGWRVGGKGASARNPEQNWRIEEHGPHIWFGFYFNAFHVIDEAYRYCVEQGLLSDGGFQSWKDAFSPRNDAVVLDYFRKTWDWWKLTLPELPGTPVDPAAGDFWSLLQGGLRLLDDRRAEVHAAVPALRRRTPQRGLALRSLTGLHKLAARAHGVHSGFTELDHDHLFQSLGNVAKIEAERVRSGRWAWLGRLGLWIIDRLLGKLVRDLLDAVRHLLETNDDLRHAWQILDLGVAMLRGIIRDNVLIHGFDAIEDWDLSRWLERNGCSDSWSPLIRSIYDSGAHYEGGRSDTTGSPNIRPDAANLAAGTALHSLLRMFAGYRGSYSYRMNAGMGETVFTPLYLALSRRGVKFAFFHRVRGLKLNEAKDAIAAIDLDVQATVTEGATAYRPLLPPFHGLRCWPNMPFFDQLAEGEEIKSRGLNLESAWCDFHVRTKTLRVGPGLDCDKVVLGISVASLPEICCRLAEASSAWRDMLGAIKSVQTQFCEIWMKCAGSELRPDEGTPTAEGFLEPIDTWLDMSQVLPREGWTGPPGSVHYFVGPLADVPAPPPGKPSDFPAEQWQRVFDTMRGFVEKNLLTLWPLASVPGQPGVFNWDLMRSSSNAAGWERLREQYVRANVDPADRYVLSVAGSKKFRLPSNASGFANLYLAGDWTRNGINAGSVEAAVMSGMQASQGISGYPKTILGGWEEMDNPTAPIGKGAAAHA